MQVKGESIDTECPHEAVKEIGIAVEAIIEVVRRRAIAGTWIVRSEQPPAVGERGHKIAELVGRAGVAVGQQHHGGTSPVGGHFMVP